MKRSLSFISDAEKLRTSNVILIVKQGGFFLDFLFSMYFTRHGLICHPSDSTVSEDAGIEPRNVATLALAVRRSVTSRLVFIYFSSKFWYFHRYWEYLITSQWTLKVSSDKNLTVTVVSLYMFSWLYILFDWWNSPEMCTSHWVLCAQMHHVSGDSYSKPAPRPPKKS